MGSGRWRPGSDAGSAAVELAVLFPMFLTLVLLAVQAALWFHARNVALAAARDGVHVARLQGSSPARGQVAAAGFVTQVGAGVLTHPVVDTSGSSPTQVWVRVSGQALSILPGVAVSVSQVAHGPVERFTSGVRP